MRWKLILPALFEAQTDGWRSIKYSLFPPLGLATLAAHIPCSEIVEIADEHVEIIDFNDIPDIVVIQVYVTNANRAYKIATHYMANGATVILGGLHVSAIPTEAAKYAHSIAIGPGDDIFPKIVNDILSGALKPRYISTFRNITDIPFPRRDLIKKSYYLVPNSIVVSRGCPFSCKFCYKNDFFKGGTSYYTTTIERALSEIDSLDGKHLFFLDDNILVDCQFTINLFKELSFRKRIWQGAGTLTGILNKPLIKAAAESGLRSLFVGFESLNKDNMLSVNKKHNTELNYNEAVEILHDHGIKINASFVYGLDNDTPDTFKRTVDWAISVGITTSTFHIMTPYPGTSLFKQLKNNGRILTENWDRYTTRDVVYMPKNMSIKQLKEGYDWSYNEFYKAKNILKSAFHVPKFSQKITSALYAVGWKKAEPLWETIIRNKKLSMALPLLETTLDT